MSNTRPCSYETGKGGGLRIRKEIQVRNSWCVGAAGEEGLKERKKGRECSMRKKRRAIFDMGCKMCVHGNGLHLWMLLALPFSCPPLPLGISATSLWGSFCKDVWYSCYSCRYSCCCSSYLPAGDTAAAASPPTRPFHRFLHRVAESVREEVAFQSDESDEAGTISPIHKIFDKNSPLAKEIGVKKGED